ncbi:N-acetyltransferase [Streptomyces sp. NPDC126497]|uniref:N-acetyltransferase n=1 Tax=Streptomyces sp. NPDC126497 TaxID=3155313 RepID=UPI0033168EB1
MLQSPAPGAAGEECLLLVHIRKVVGRVTYRTCEECAKGVITDVVIDGSFRDSGLGTRALSHLRSRYPGVTWRATDGHRLTRDLLHRIRIPRVATEAPCSHLRSAAAAGSAG